jgi:hypothetical protein
MARTVLGIGTMQTLLLRSVLFLALAGGCAGSGQFTYASQATVPDLVVISPGVQVIANYDEPIFYSDNYYWRNEGGFWYRSANHTRGWARVEVAPVRIRAIAQPSAYVRYRAEARVAAPRQNDDHDRNDGKDKHDRNDGKDKHDRNDGRDKHDKHDGKDKHDKHDKRD